MEVPRRALLLGFVCAIVSMFSRMLNSWRTPMSILNNSNNGDGETVASIVGRLEKSHSAIQEIMSLSGTVGASVGVLHHGQVIHTSHFGYRDLNRQLKPDDETIYPICSLSKSITAATIGILVEEGHFTWDTKIIDVLPEFAVEDDDLRLNGTLLDILSHRSGLQGSNMWLGSQNNVLFPASDAMKVVNSLKMAHPFRSAWEYSNYGYEIAAQMIRRKLNQPWHVVVTDKVLKPLELWRTGFDSEFGAHDNVAEAYATLDDATPVLIEGPKLDAYSILGAGGGIRSSLKDMLEIYRLLLKSAGEESRGAQANSVEGPFKNVQAMFSSHISLLGPKYGTTGYGFGLARVLLPGPMGAIGTNPALYPDMPVVGRASRPRTTIYHQGTLAGAFATVVLFPETESGIVVLTNSLPLTGSDDWISQLLTETIFSAEKTQDFVVHTRKTAESQRGWHERVLTELRQDYRPGTQPKTLDQYVGRYYNSARTLLIKIFERHGTLVMNFQDNPAEDYDLKHHQDDTFTWLSSRNELASRGRFTRFGAWFYTIKFIANAEGNISSLNWAHDAARKEGEEFTKS